MSAYREKAQVEDDEIDLEEVLANEKIQTTRAFLATMRDLLERIKTAPSDEANALSIVVERLDKGIDYDEGDE